MGAVSRKRIERRLAALSERLGALRDEVAVCNAQLDQVADEADDARLRALVSDRPMERSVGRDAQRAADTLRRRRDRVAAKIVELESRQDELLDQLVRLED